MNPNQSDQLEARRNVISTLSAGLESIIDGYTEGNSRLVSDIAASATSKEITRFRFEFSKAGEKVLSSQSDLDSLSRLIPDDKRLYSKLCDVIGQKSDEYSRRYSEISSSRDSNEDHKLAVKKTRQLSDVGLERNAQLYRYINVASKLMGEAALGNPELERIVAMSEKSGLGFNYSDPVKIGKDILKSAVNDPGFLAFVSKSGQEYRAQHEPLKNEHFSSEQIPVDLIVSIKRDVSNEHAERKTALLNAPEDSFLQTKVKEGLKSSVRHLPGPSKSPRFMTMESFVNAAKNELAPLIRQYDKTESFADSKAMQAKASELGAEYDKMVEEKSKRAVLDRIAKEMPNLYLSPRIGGVSPFESIPTQRSDVEKKLAIAPKVGMVNIVLMAESGNKDAIKVLACSFKESRDLVCQGSFKIMAETNPDAFAPRKSVSKESSISR